MLNLLNFFIYPKLFPFSAPRAHHLLAKLHQSHRQHWNLRPNISLGMVGIGVLRVSIFLNLVAYVLSREEPCDFYLAPSLVPGGGRGIFAGRFFEKGDVVDVASTFSIRGSAMRNWMLQNYVYSTEEEGYSMVVLGIAMLFNHRIPESATHFWVSHNIARAEDNRYIPHSVFTPVLHRSLKVFVPGQEIFTTYGGRNWFEDRGLTETIFDATNPQLAHDEPLVDVTHLEEAGVCMTDVYVAESSKPMAGNGLFATRRFSKGDLISVSPVLIMPRHGVENLTDPDSVLQNYCISTEKSEVALLPIGYAALANHDSSPNMMMEWFSWPASPDTVQRALGEKNLSSLMKSPFSPLDIAYIATRNIEKDEELTINYGASWLDSWATYLARYADWLESGGSLKARPIFRHFVEAPPGLFPLHWFDKRLEACSSNDGECLDEAAFERAASKRPGPFGAKLPVLKPLK